MNEIDFILEQLKGLTAIDSPTGFTEYAAEHVMNIYKKMGYAPVQTAKGGIFIDLGGKNEEDAILLTAHMDTLGAMVHTVKSNGRLKLTPLGGLNPNNTEGENCRIYTRSGRIYDGTFQLIDASIHVNGEYNDTKRSFDTMEVVLDEDVYNKEGVEALGIRTGDIVCFDPRTRITDSGYIKSRFLDDKLSVAILMGYANYLQEQDIKVGLASSTAQHLVRDEIGTAGLLPYFQTLVCGDMVEHSKPAPDIFLKACEILNADPTKSIAIEDSFNGIRSAHCAGMTPIMVPDQVQPTDEIRTLAFHVMPSLLDVLNWLKTLA